MLTPEQVKSIWDSGQGDRNAMATQQKFYEGKQALLGIDPVRKDGVLRSQIIINWYETVVNSHVGFMTSDRTEYSVEDDKDAKAKRGLDEFNRVYKENKLQAAGIEHLTNCLNYGNSIEVHSYEDDEIRITATSPQNWVLVRDEDGNIKAGVLQAKIPAWQFFKGELLEKEKTVFSTYDDKMIVLYETSNRGGALALIEEKPHTYGRPPLVEFFLKRDRSRHFGTSFDQNANAYNVTRSLLQDEIKINIDALLTTSGLKMKTILEKDEKGKSALQHMKEMGLLVMPEGASAQWLTRNLDSKKFEMDLEVSRAAIHQQGYIPDIAQSLSKGGAVSQISGVALRLLFQPMLQKSKQYAKHYKQGLLDRVELINIINTTLSRPIYDNPKVKINHALPRNATELLQYLPAAVAAEVISSAESVRQLDFIEDPERVASEIKTERAERAQNPQGTE